MNEPQAISEYPIADMCFSGLHLIEASAGTGKTYTLSSLIVRILIEKYLPNQIIATTFTRAAAAELKSRIRSRLVEAYQYFNDCQDLTEIEMLHKAEQEKDPLYQVLCKQFSTQVGYVCERLKLVIDQLDELFVSTLDSFSQKLLREFAFESGKIERAQLTEDAKAYSQQIVHDILREWIQAQPQPLIDYLLLSKQLKNTDGYLAIVENSLNFSSAQFMPVAVPVMDLEKFEAELDLLLKLDLSLVEGLADYYRADGQHNSIVGKKWRTEQLMETTLCQNLPDFIKALHTQRSYALFAAHWTDIFKCITDLATKKVLNKCAVEVLEYFENHQIIQGLRRFCECVANLKTDLSRLDTYLQFYISQEVRKRLPQLLQQRGETTFSQQIRTLAEALQGEQGQRFAVYVQARYPLIVVDEFQDTNQDQDNMLASIWRHPQRHQHSCMIMVGDPKQAIYGFRGGDMLTYIKARQDVLIKQGKLYTLRQNHRSVPELVEVVDALFQREVNFGEEVIYTPIQAGARQHPPLTDRQRKNYCPLRWVQLSDKNKEAEQVAWKIRQLLNHGIAKELLFDESGGQRPLNENDIAILSKNHDGLDKAQYALESLGIRVNRPSKRSVFDCQVARDVGALLTAIMHPYDEGKVKRALLSRLLDFNLQSLVELEQRTDGLSSFIHKFDDIRELWLERGFLSAWQYCLQHFQVWQKLVAIASKDNERAVVNLRHLTEVLSQHSEIYPGAKNLYYWYFKQLQSPSEREWELERRLSNEAGVQLMTIHQSKGLEFKVVFLLGADKAFKEMNKTLNFSTVEQLNPVTGQLEKQRVIAVADKNLLDENAVNQHQERAAAENRRLWYVALTRASHRVYAMLQDTEGKAKDSLAFWRNRAEPFVHRHCMDELLLEQLPAKVSASSVSKQISVQALNLPQQRFYPRAKTSFSYLAQHLKTRKIFDPLANEVKRPESAEDELHVVDKVYLPATQPLSWIKQNFPMGTVAGNFLHEIFEHIDFQEPADWILEIRRRFKNDYSGLWNELRDKYQRDFPEQAEDEQLLLNWLAEWLQQVLATPLHAGFELKQLQPEQHLAEFPFCLALSDHVLAIQRIHQLFAEYGIDMPELNPAESARYLNGSIDLVYFDGHQYHIADYKSNFLGSDQSDYNHASIRASMSHSSYWLQAGLYLVALHRYLSIQMQNYEISRDLGGASYLYLRGMNGQPDHGVYYWKPSTEFILRLDALLGYFIEDKMSKIA